MECTKDLVVAAPLCYTGSGGALGLKDVVGVKIDDLEANAAGHMEAAGSGIAASICSNKAFTKSGLVIATVLSECLPHGITIPEIDLCSFQDVVKVTREVMGGCHRPAPISFGATTRGLLYAKLWVQWWSVGLRF